MIRYIDTVNGYMTYFGEDYEKFADTEMYQDACLSKLNQICQCADRIRDHHADVYERYMNGFVGDVVAVRNMVIHRYVNINLRLIWTFLTDEMPELRTICVNMLSDLSEK